MPTYTTADIRKLLRILGSDRGSVTPRRFIGFGQDGNLAAISPDVEVFTGHDIFTWYASDAIRKLLPGAPKSIDHTPGTFTFGIVSHNLEIADSDSETIRHFGRQVSATSAVVEQPELPIVLNPAQLAIVNSHRSDDEARPILCAALVENGLIIATDSYRLCILPIASGHGAGMLPGAVLDAVEILAGKRDSAHFRIDSDAVIASVGKWTARARLVDGEFPNWKVLIPKVWNYRACFASPAATADTLRAIHKSSTHTLPTVRWHDATFRMIDDGELKAEAPAPAIFGGDTLPEIGFSARFLAESLAVGGAEPVTAAIVDELKALKLDGKFGTSLLMPIRIGA